MRAKRAKKTFGYVFLEKKFLLRNLFFSLTSWPVFFKCFLPKFKEENVFTSMLLLLLVPLLLLLLLLLLLPLRLLPMLLPLLLQAPYWTFGAFGLIVLR